METERFTLQSRSLEDEKEDPLVGWLLVATAAKVKYVKITKPMFYKTKGEKDEVFKFPATYLEEINFKVGIRIL